MPLTRVTGRFIYTLVGFSDPHEPVRVFTFAEALR